MGRTLEQKKAWLTSLKIGRDDLVKSTIQARQSQLGPIDSSFTKGIEALSIKIYQLEQEIKEGK